MAMVKNLAGTARGRANGFGLKLSNTLEVVNHRPVFPANEKMMYMSGRALHPLTLTLAQLVDRGAGRQGAHQLLRRRRRPQLPGPGGRRPGARSRSAPICSSPAATPGCSSTWSTWTRPWTEAGAGSLDAYVQATSGGHGARFNLARHAVRVVGDDAYARRPRPLEFKGDRPLGQLRLHRRALHGRLPRAPEHPRLPLAGGPRPARGGHGRHPAHQPPARHHRQRLRPPLHRALRAQLLRRAPGHPRDQAVRLRVRRRPPGNPRRPATASRWPSSAPARPACPRPTSWPGWASRPEVFEAKAALGGMVSGVIPGYRLSGETLAADLERLRPAGRPVPLRPGPGPRPHPGGPAPGLPLRLPGGGRQAGQAPGHPGRRQRRG